MHWISCLRVLLSGSRGGGHVRIILSLLPLWLLSCSRLQEEMHKCRAHLAALLQIEEVPHRVGYMFGPLSMSKVTGQSPIPQARQVQKKPQL